MNLTDLPALDVEAFDVLDCGCIASRTEFLACPACRAALASQFAALPDLPILDADYTVAAAEATL